MTTSMDRYIKDQIRVARIQMGGLLNQERFHQRQARSHQREARRLRRAVERVKAELKRLNAERPGPDFLRTKKGD